MTAQELNHVAHLAFVRAQAATCSAEQWDAVVSLKSLAQTIATREIAEQGYSEIYARMK